MKQISEANNHIFKNVYERDPNQHQELTNKKNQAKASGRNRENTDRIVYWNKFLISSSIKEIRQLSGIPLKGKISKKK